jgi:hypothetical protein
VFPCNTWTAVQRSSKVQTEQWLINNFLMQATGSFLVKSLHMEMENSIFHKLSNTRVSCWSKDWFGRAEQAINIIYVLSTLTNLVITLWRTLPGGHFPRGKIWKSLHPSQTQRQWR